MPLIRPVSSSQTPGRALDGGDRRHLARIERIALLLPTHRPNTRSPRRRCATDSWPCTRPATAPDKPAVKVYDIGANPAQAAR